MENQSQTVTEVSIASPKTSTEQPGTATRHDGNNFDLLRLSLALTVALYHVFIVRGGDPEQARWHSGDIAVDLFFAISGFLMPQSWRRSNGLPDYLLKRYLRIYPGFIACMLICGLVIGPAMSDRLGYWRHFNTPQFVAGILCLHKAAIPNILTGAANQEINLPVWTISYEFVCYLVVALLGMLNLLRRGIMIGLLLPLVSTYVLQQAHVIASDHIWYWWGSPTSHIRFLTMFLLGALFQEYRAQIPLRGPIAVLALATLLFVPANWFLIVFPICGIYLCFYVALALPIKWKPKHDISYGVYLYHYPLFQLILFAKPRIGEFGLILAGLPLAVIAGAASWILIESPLLKLKRAAGGADRRKIRGSVWVYRSK